MDWVIRTGYQENPGIEALTWFSHTETPCATFILGSEKIALGELVVFAVGGLWDYTMQRHRKITLFGVRNRANNSIDANLLIPKPKPLWCEIHVR